MNAPLTPSLSPFGTFFFVRRTAISALVSLGSLSASMALAAPMEEFVIIGSKEDARTVAGSGAVIGADQIRVEAATDINQLLKTVPGIYIREEEGLGLRPNIGIRGATSERSSKVTLMEDGVMIAPAPYADPAAYYFPTTMRQSGVEVLKGAQLLRYGPQTTGGVVNLISTPIPAAAAGQIRLLADERGSGDLHAWYGDRQAQWGWLLETVQRAGDGFKDIDRHGNRGDFRIEDYVGKLSWRSSGAGPEQSLQLKLQYSEEVSEETYLGLTDEDFNANPNRRYGLSAIDEMGNRHSGVQLTYSIALADNIRASVLAYNNDFKRDWFKLDGGSTYINAANSGSQTAQEILDGVRDVAGLRYKHNNRTYESRGVETNFNLLFGAHSLDVGVRIHGDESDRFQTIEIYDQVGGALQYRNTLMPGASDNRVARSNAVSGWLADNWQLSEALKLSAVLRYEDVESKERRYTDPARTLINRTTGNQTAEWLPGVALTYDLNTSLQLLAGVHRGFSPLGGGALSNEDPEISVNWEAGLRYQLADWFLEAIGFYSDFSDKTENCSVGSPCSNGETSGTYVTGEARVAGIEFQAGTLFQRGNLTIPVDFAYTWTDAEISKNNPQTAVIKGDLLKDVPEHLYSLRAGIEHSSGWNNYLVVKYIDSQCASIGCNRAADAFAKTESLWVADLISRYQLLGNLTLFLKVENLFDTQRIVSRDPDGARPNRERTGALGLEFSF